MKLKSSVLAFLIIIAVPVILNAQVLGSCGAPDENEPGAAVNSDDGEGAGQVQHVLRPGERAVNFSLAAVVGDEIRMVKLSDYNGQWRLVCFYPADFTFV